MKFECPECGRVLIDESIPDNFTDWTPVDGQSLTIKCKCETDYIAADNIVYEPPTGGIDPNQSPVNNISLRDYFAGQAMAGAMSASLEITKAEIQRDPSVFFDAEKIKTISDEHIYRTARDSFILADAMLKERNK